MRTVGGTSKLFHSIVVVGLGTAAGGCGSGEPASPQGASRGADAALDGTEAQGFALGSPGDASPDSGGACCAYEVSCEPSGPDGGNAANPCCPGDGGGQPKCCPNDSYACVPLINGKPPTIIITPGIVASDAGDAGIVCGCWPLFV